MILDTKHVMKLIEEGVEVVDGGRRVTKPLMENVCPTQMREGFEGGAYDLRADVFYREHPSDLVPTYIGGDLYCKPGETVRVTPRLQVVAPNQDGPGAGKPLVYDIPPHTTWWLKTFEWVNLPSYLVAQIVPRTSIFRGGGILGCSTADPNYQGTLTMSLTNLRDTAFRIEKGARVAKVRFARLLAPEEKLYDGVWQGGRVTTDGEKERAY